MSCSLVVWELSVCCDFMWRRLFCALRSQKRGAVVSQLGRPSTDVSSCFLTNWDQLILLFTNINQLKNQLSAMFNVCRGHLGLPSRMPSFTQATRFHMSSSYETNGTIWQDMVRLAVDWISGNVWTCAGVPVSLNLFVADATRLKKTSEQFAWECGMLINPAWIAWELFHYLSSLTVSTRSSALN